MAEPSESVRRREVKVTTILIYPIKSCRGFSVPQAPLSSTGFRWDRQWLVINSKGRAYTQRNEPKLALVQTELPVEAFSEGYQPTKSSCLVLKAPGMIELKVPFTKPHEVSDGVSVWEWCGSALDEGAEASEWFSTYLGKPSRLVRFNEGSNSYLPLRKLFKKLGTLRDCQVHDDLQKALILKFDKLCAAETRAVDPEYARGYKIMFSDQYPFLMISESSMNAFNKILKEPVPINRFRPNIVVDGCEPFAEDLWTEIKINKFTFHGVKLCSRCKVPTINQETAIADPEITETLKTFRSDKVLRPSKKQQGLVYFGQNMVCMDSLTEGKGKIIKVGDPITVLKVVPSSDDAPA